MKEKKLGLFSLIATGAGLIVATSCLLAIGQGVSAIGPAYIFSMIIACLLNILTALSVCELNAVMPKLTGGLAQYTLACLGPFITIIAMVGGYIISLSLIGGVEGAMFGNTMTMLFPSLGIPEPVYGIVLMVALVIFNLNGLDLFAKVQNVVAYGLIISLILMGLIGCFNMGQETPVQPDISLATEFGDVVNYIGLAFYMFVGCEFIVSIGGHVKNERRNIPLSMILSLVVVFVMQAVCVFGFSKYVPQETLGESGAPHILYGIAILGEGGRYWMGLVSILAVISTANTILSSLSYILSGMAKINLLPSAFMKHNKKGAPFVGILFIGSLMLIVSSTGLAASEAISFFMLVASVLWIIVYALLHVNVILLRFRQPKVPRTFKVPFGIVIPLLGIVGDIVMIYGIDSDASVKLKVYGACILAFVVLGLYAGTWIRYKMKAKPFAPVPVKDVMAMENEMYHRYHR